MPITPNRNNVRKLMDECNLSAGDIAPFMYQTTVEVRNALCKSMRPADCVQMIDAIRRAARLKGCEIIEYAATGDTEFTVIHH